MFAHAVRLYAWGWRGMHRALVQAMLSGVNANIDLMELQGTWIHFIVPWSLVDTESVPERPDTGVVLFYSLLYEMLK